MKDGVSVIKARFDAGLNAFVVKLPEFVPLNCLREWGEAFLLELEGHIS